MILWDAATGARLSTLRGHTNVVTDVAFCPDNRVLATASQDDTARLWDVASGKLLRVLPASSVRTGIGNGVSSIAFSGDGTLLATGSVEKVQVWALTDEPGRPPAPRSVLRGPSDHRAAGVAFSPDGRRLAAAFRTVWTGRVLAWELSTGAETLPLEANQGVVNGVCFSPDGRYLAADVLGGGNVGGVRLWDAATGRLLQTIAGHRGDVHGLAISPTGE